MELNINYQCEIIIFSSHVRFLVFFFRFILFSSYCIDNIMMRVCVCLFIRAAIAFSVPLTDDEESLVKKHPPKRLRMLEGQQSPPLTREMLTEKLAEAEQRRQQVIRSYLVLHNNIRSYSEECRSDLHDSNRPRLSRLTVYYNYMPVACQYLPIHF